MNISDPLRWSYRRPESDENENLLLQDLSNGPGQLSRTRTITSTDSVETPDHVPSGDPYPRVTPLDLLGSGSNGLTEPSINGSVYLTSARTDHELVDPKQLHAYITDYLSLVPPEIVMRVRGSRRDTTRAGADAIDAVVDFDFTIALRGLFGPKDDPTPRACRTRSSNTRTARVNSEETEDHDTPRSFEYPERSSPARRDRKQSSRNWMRHVRIASFAQLLSIFPDVPALFRTSVPYLSDWRVHHAQGSGLGAYEETSSSHSAQATELEDSLLARCEDFCARKASRKKFRVTRAVTGLNLDAIKANVAAQLFQHHFGQIEVGFTTIDRHVDIYPPGSLRRICTEQRVLRTCFGALSIILYGLAIVISICLLFTGLLLAVQVEMAAVSYLTWRHTYDVASLYFRALFGTIAVGGTLLSLLAFVRQGVIATFEVKHWSDHSVEWTAWRWDESAGQRTRQHAGLNEVEWVQKYAPFLRRLVENKFHGDATDLMDACVRSQ